MELFTGWQYLLIDVANQAGHDKLLFAERIQWTLDRLDQLEALADAIKPKDRPLYLKAVMAVRRAQAGQSSGHLVAFDAVCSGLQIMSAVTGCPDGARATGLIDTGKRPDAYTEATERMGFLLGSDIVLDRDKIKKGVMTRFYGSRAEPLKLFGKDTPELAAFYEALTLMAPGACDLLQVLLDSWDHQTLAHQWLLPDGHLARVKVMVQKQTTIEVDELDGLTFEYVYDNNEASMKRREVPTLANVANVVHSLDAYVLRSLLRRCNYDPRVASRAHDLIEAELLERSLEGKQPEPVEPGSWEEWATLASRWEATRMADVAILPWLNAITVGAMDEAHLRQLKRVLNTMLLYKPFPVITIHDSFAAHPNHLNWVRHWYKELLAELAESTVIDDILSQLYGFKGHFQRRSPDLAEHIRASEYALS